jgi:hypothetical protein
MMLMKWLSKVARKQYLPDNLQNKISIEKYDFEIVNGINSNPDYDLPF